MKKNIINLFLSIFVIISAISISTPAQALTASDIAMLQAAGIISSAQATALTSGLTPSAPTTSNEASVTNSVSTCIDLPVSIYYGSTDATTNGNVTVLQDFLQTNGYLTNNPTGFYGMMTVNAVKKFQTAYGINPVGFAGDMTRAKIKELTCGNTPTQVIQPVTSVSTSTQVVVNKIPTPTITPVTQIPTQKCTTQTTYTIGAFGTLVPQNNTVCNTVTQTTVPTTPQYTATSCSTQGTLLLEGNLGCDIVANGSIDLANSYCVSNSGKKAYLKPDDLGRPNRYYNILSGLSAGDTVNVYVKGALNPIQCFPILNTPAGAANGSNYAILSITKNAALSNITTIPNKTSVKIGSYILQADSSEEIRVTELTVAISGAIPTYTSLQNLYVIADGVATTPITPMYSNIFPIDFKIPANGTKIVDIYADILNQNGTISTTLTAKGYGVNSNLKASPAIVNGQTVSIGSNSTLSVTFSTTTSPAPLSVVSENTTSKIADFKFVSTNSDSIITELAFKVDGPIENITVGGVTQVVIPGATTIVSGLNIVVPAGYSGTIVPVTVKYGTVAPTMYNSSYDNQPASVVLNSYKYNSGSITKLVTTSVSSNVVTVKSSASATTQYTATSCSTQGTVLSGGNIGCDMVANGTIDLPNSYCRSSSGKQVGLSPDTFGRPNRYYATLSGLSAGDIVDVYAIGVNSTMIQCLPRLNTLQTTATTPAPVITTLFAPSPITVGQSTTLSWTTTNANTCSLEKGNALNPQGSYTITNPASTFTITLSCSGPGGTTNKSTTVVVNPAPTTPAPIISSLNPTSGPAGTVVTITGSGFVGVGSLTALSGYGDSQLPNLNVTSPTSATFIVPNNWPIGSQAIYAEAIGVTGQSTAYFTVTQAVTTPAPVTGDISVSIDPTISSGNIPVGQNSTIARYKFTNNSNTTVTVKNITLLKGGVAPFAALSNPSILKNGANITTQGTKMSGQIIFNNTSGLFTIAQGESVTIDVKATISNTNGQNINLSITSIAASVPVSASYPITGPMMMPSGSGALINSNVASVLSSMSTEDLIKLIKVLTGQY